MTNITPQDQSQILSQAERSRPLVQTSRTSKAGPAAGQPQPGTGAEANRKNADEVGREPAAIVVPDDENAFEIDVEPELRLRVRFDEPAGRFVYQEVNPKNGEVERQFPPDEALQRIARNRDIAGLTLDEKL